MFKSLSKGQVIGTFIGLAGSLICFLFEKQFEYGFFHRTLRINEHGFPAIVLAIILLAVMVFRNIFDYKSMDKVDKLFVIVSQLMIFSALFALFLAAKSTFSPIVTACALTFMVAMLLFGLRGLCKLSLFVSLAVIVGSRFHVIGEAMGFWGVVVVLMWFSSFYLQETIVLGQLKSELALLWGRSATIVSNTIAQSETDFQKVGKMAQNAAGIHAPFQQQEKLAKH